MPALQRAARLALAVALTSATLLTAAGLARSLARERRLPEPVPNAMAAGNLHLQQGRWREAAAQYQAVVAINPSERNAWFYLGLALAGAGDAAGLAEAHRSALRDVPSSAAALREGARAAEDWRRLAPAERARVQGGGS